jgi:hypothetical protein
MVLELRHNLRHSKQEIENLKDLNGVNLKPLSFSSSKAGDNSTTRSETNGSVKVESISSTPTKFQNQSVKSSPRRNSSSNNSSVFRMSSLAPSVTSENWITVFRSEMQRALDNGRCRVMTLNECKETIEKIIEGKRTMNAKVLENANIGNNPVMVLETIEQYYYRSLEQKYGLRNLAVEHAGVLLSSVEKYYEEDNSIHVFLKIFKNEVEEDFWIVQNDLTKSIRDLMAVQIMGRYPNKDQSSLNILLDQKKNGVLTENEWTDITNYLYSSSDSMAVGIILKRLAREAMKAKGQGKESSKSISDPKRLGYISPSVHKSVISSKLNHENDGKDYLAARVILNLSFVSFLKCVLDFQVSFLNIIIFVINNYHYNFVIFHIQLRSHVQYLDFFRKTFEHFDTDLDGVLNVNEFKGTFFNEISYTLISLFTKHILFLLDFFCLLRKGTSPAGSRVNVGDSFDSSFGSLLNAVDPLDSGKIIFSFAACFLSQLIAEI